VFKGRIFVVLAIGCWLAGGSVAQAVESAQAVCVPGVVLPLQPGVFASDAKANVCTDKNGKLDDVQFEKSPFPACADVKITTQEKDCPTCDVTVQSKPKAGMIDVLLKAMNRDFAPSAFEFLEKVGDKTVDNLKRNYLLTEKLQGCAKVKNPSEICQENLSQLRSIVAEARPEIRRLLALARGKSNWLAEGVLTGVDVNEKLESFHGQVTPKMDPLTPEELAAATAQFKKDTDEIDKSYFAAQKERKAAMEEAQKRGVPIRSGEADAIMDFKAFRDQARAIKRDAYIAQYLAIVQKAPILTMIGSANPTNDEIVKAAGSLMVNANKEAEVAKGILAKGRKLKAEGKTEKGAEALEKLMRYGPVVNEVLAESTKYCGTATGLAERATKVQLAKTVGMVGGGIGLTIGAAIGAPLLAGSLGLAWNAAMVGGVSAGLVGGGYFYTNDYKNLQATKQRTVTQPDDQTGKPVGDIKDLSEAQKVWDLDLALMATGMDFYGTGVFKAGGSALIGASIGKVLEKQVAKDAMVARLMAKNVSKERAGQLVGQLASKDEKVVQKASQEVLAVLDKDPTKLVRRLSDNADKFKEVKGVRDAIRTEVFDTQIKGQTIEGKVINSLDDMSPAMRRDFEKNADLYTASIYEQYADQLKNMDEATKQELIRKRSAQALQDCGFSVAGVAK